MPKKDWLAIWRESLNPLAKAINDAKASIARDQAALALSDEQIQADLDPTSDDVEDYRKRAQERIERNQRWLAAYEP